MLTFAFLTGVDVPGLVIGLTIFWIAGYFIARFILKKIGKGDLPKYASVIIGFFLAPLLLGLTIFLLIRALH
jgi:hypothetical protein